MGESRVKTPIWSVGFRPFFIGGLVNGLLIVFLWASYFFGLVSLGKGIDWHKYEMLFGFVMPIIAGFLLTASSHWAGLKPVSGKPLVVLFVFWLLARISGYLPAIYFWVSPIFDSVFLFGLSVLLKPYLWPEDGKTRNRFFLVMLIGLALFRGLYGASEIVGFGFVKIEWLTLGCFCLMALIIGGRIIPLFTGNALGLKTTTNRRVYLPAISGVAICWVYLSVFPSNIYVGILFMVSSFGLLFCYKDWGWQKIFSNSLLWSLHLGFIWLILGHFLWGLSSVVDFNGSLALHLVTVGGLGGLIVAMVSRVSLGHTGRPLRAPRIVSLAYIVFHLGVIVRVLLPFVFPAFYSTWIFVAGIMWVVSFGALSFYYLPILIMPRADGKVG